MAFLITLGELRETAQQLANKPNDTTLPVAEWNGHISAYYGRAHTMVLGKGARYFETEFTLDLATLALPTDHRGTIGVDFITSCGARIELDELMVQDRDLFSGLTGTQARAWAVVGTNVQLFPTPTTGDYRLLYEPQPARYNTSVDSIQIDVMTTDGLDAITWGAASVALHRLQTDQSRALQENEDAMARLEDWAVRRSVTMPRRRQILGRNGRLSGNINGPWNPASWVYNR